MPPMARARAFKNSDTPTNLMETYYAQRALTGLMISEPIYVSENSRINNNTSLLTHSRHVQAWAKINEAVKEELGVLFACLSHGGGFAHSEFSGGDKPLSPSGIKLEEKKFNFDGEKYIEQDESTQMSESDIESVISDFINASVNAFDAKFDGVVLDFSSKGLLYEFVTKAHNKRKDKWGYNKDNSLFASALIEAMCHNYGRDQVAIRVDISQLSQVMNAVEKNQIAMVQVTGKIKEYKLISELKTLSPNTLLSYEGELDLKYFTKLINERNFDLISIKDYFISNPDLAQRIRKGLPLLSPPKVNPLRGKEDNYIDFPNFSLRAM